jgi:solute carrier family 45 protein 1/2/4
VIVQPYVGIASDQSQHRWGRRRPFILAGAAGTVLCILGMASTRSFVNFLIGVFNGDIHSSTSVVLRIIVAVSWLYGLNFFIQPFQGGIRALIVDVCPANQQAQASAYASLMTGSGNIIGYLFGFVNLKDAIGLSGISQFTFLCIVAAIAVSTTVGSTCFFIKEQDPTTLVVPQMEDRSVLSRLKNIAWSAKTMPMVIQKVCVVQFFAWMGWFPFLFYISSFVGNMCK